MIKLFASPDDANEWIGMHPGFEAVGMMAGLIAGSVYVLFRYRRESAQVSEPPRVSFGPVKRRGRPPKVRV